MADTTFYATTQVVATLAKSTGVSLKTSGKRSFDTSFSFRDERDAKLYRAVVCSCYAGNSWSITGRDSDRAAASVKPLPPQLERPAALPDAHALEAWPA